MGGVGERSVSLASCLPSRKVGRRVMPFANRHTNRRERRRPGQIAGMESWTFCLLLLIGRRTAITCAPNEAHYKGRGSKGSRESDVDRSKVYAAQHREI
jgi:hypothetical protein